MPMLDPFPSSPYTLLVAGGVERRCARCGPPTTDVRSLRFVPLAEPDADLSLETATDRRNHLRAVALPRRHRLHETLQPPLPEADTVWLQERPASPGQLTIRGAVRFAPGLPG